MQDPATFLEIAALAVALFGTQVYNEWRHRQHEDRMTSIAGARRTSPPKAAPNGVGRWVDSRPSRTLPTDHTE